MEKLFATLREVYRIYIAAPFQNMHLTDVLDILALTALLYLVYSFVRVRRAGRVAFGLLLIFGMYGVFGLFGLRATHELMRIVFSSGIIVLAVIFQSELRAGLEKLGNSLSDLRSGMGQGNATTATMVNEVVDAVCTIAQQEHDGALIVIERSTPLGEYADNGTKLDAIVSSKLLVGLFIDKAPLHDGAVIIKDDRVVSAACKLPIKSSSEDAAGMGTRHRAALAISEESDCVVAVVSEEKHIISIANNGNMKRDYNPRGMEDLRTEEGFKSVQKKLREDLFLLVMGAKEEEQSKKSRKGKKGRKGNADETENVGKRPAHTKPAYRLATLVRLNKKNDAGNSDESDDSSDTGNGTPNS